jgi:hypothetical protein
MTQRLDARNPGAHLASWSTTAINEYDTNHGGMGAWSTTTPLKLGDPNDSGTPVYLAQDSDPTFTLHCFESWGCPSLEGAIIHIPIPYVTASTDAGFARMAVVSPDKSETYELYETAQPSGSTINLGSGARFLTNGIGWATTLGANQGSASFVAGLVTAEDFLQGAINHALIVAAPCQNGSVYPTNFSANDLCSSGKGAPLGSRLWLDMTDAQIDALGMPATKTIVAKTLAHYGAFIMNNEPADLWSIYRSGAAGPDSEVSAWKSVKSTLLGGSNDWLEDGWPAAVVNSFHFLDPCVTQLTC